MPCPQNPLNTAERSNNDWGCARGAAERVGVPEIPVGAALQIAISGRGHFAPPSLDVDAAAVVREVEAGAIRSVVASVRSRRRRASADEDGAGGRVRGVERV